ncbi:hypothetical protein [Embleya sp. NBC_00896]|nr:hypothetical protein OG928_48075 [Embleya sp. NBC_00896]
MNIIASNNDARPADPRPTDGGQSNEAVRQVIADAARQQAAKPQ